ncbi:kinase-like protein, partial [Serendipita vermifera]
MDDFDWRSAIPDLSGELTSINFQRPLRGGYSIVYQGQWKGRIVAVKVLSPVGPLHSMKRKIQREGTIWATLNHPNVLPLLGFAEDENMFLPFGAFISPWCSCGSSEEYINERGNVLSLRDRIELLRGTAKGVHYLHTFTPPLIHGDIKPLNVLITEDGTPQLCDFGLARIILEEGSSGLTTTSIHGGTERYLAPELLEFDDSHLPTLEADLYALGCVGLKFTFLTPPYANRANNLRGQIFADIRSGLPPATFPEDMDPESESLSAIFRQTWDSDPSSRPN